MSRTGFVLLHLAGWATLIAVACLLATNLARGAASLSPTGVPGSSLALVLIAAMVGSVQITRRFEQRRAVLRGTR